MVNNHKKIGDISGGGSKDYFKMLEGIFLRTEVAGAKARAASVDAAVARIISLIMRQKNKGNKIIFVGNGGSASIASHIATDFLKNALIPAIAFNDASLITCISNDLGYEHVFEHPIKILSARGDILFCISSSGKSKNILNASKAAKKKGAFLVTLSGFSRGNPLRRLGDINFYVPSFSYGYVEIIHMAICHNIVDKIMQG